ncbi:MAG: ribonuclease R [Patescibacteria group bacterium]|mgnify:CR=1 FL=1
MDKVQSKKKPFFKNQKSKQNSHKTVAGIIRISSKPMGFLVLNDEEEVVIFEENLNCSLDKDEVEVEVIGKDRDRKKGKVIKIIKRYKTRFVGTLEKYGNGLMFAPDDWRFYKNVDLSVLPKEARAGLKALVEIKEWANQNLNPKGEIIKIIGEKGVHETEMQSILLDKGIVYDFPIEVEKEAMQEAEKYSSEYFSARRDFRGITTFTIDPVDAKDFDDALSYEDLRGDVLRVGVHIADVSHFVRLGTALDREARKRAFSTYLVDRTIPMLPEVLSNDLCSLKPNVDRLAFGAVFDIDKSTGKILDKWFGKTIINSNKRFSYEEAQETLELRDKNYELWKGNYGKELEELNRLANIYREENKKNGAIEFETEEVKFELDSQGKPIKIYKKARLDTMKMIEEWMLLANREVAYFISQRLKKRGSGASLFRIHDLPKMEKLEDLAIFVRALGHELNIKNGSISAKDMNVMLSSIEGHASESLIKTAAVRSMAKAVYSTKNIGHFGLAFEYYTHFTSPIRRYADLIIHRILENHLNNGPTSKDEFESFSKIALEVSEKEIVIAEAERESIKYKQVEYMQSKIGQEFECTISGVTEWGMYVEDPETKSEGLIRLKDMTDDYFALDEKNYCVIGQKTKKKYSLGDKVKTKLVTADLDRKTLDFKLVV